jgi:16S rRNA U516 pseudouridylate synthase RsuA-like enzyme
LYARARGVQRSDVEACRWFLIAESRAASTEDRAAFAAGRERLTRRMTAAQLTEAQRLAREWIAAFNSRAK